MNKFIESSKKERELMKKLFERNNVSMYSFTEDDSFDRHDGEYYRKDGQKIVFEVKNRAVASNKYRTTVIEKKKYDYLLEYSVKNNCIPMVFIFFSDGVYYTEDLKTAEKYFTVKRCPKTTAGNNDKIEKELCEIVIKKTNLFSA